MRENKIAETFGMTPRSRAHTSRRRWVPIMVSVVVVATIATGNVLTGGRDVEPEEPAVTVRPPALVPVGPVGPVWYDDSGLHHGGVVERTPVELFADKDDEGGSVLALVRHGALYRDPATDAVWFHPWGGRPRIVGLDSATGPGGDPESDVAAWFEGDELVVYDSARGEEISRTTQATRALTPRLVSEHVRDSNGFVHVSPEEVVWRSENGSGSGMSRLDLEAGTTSAVRSDWNGVPHPGDVHDTTRITGLGGRKHPWPALVVDAAGQEQLRLGTARHGVEPMGRLSPDGTFVLAATSDVTDDTHGAVIVDVRSGELSRLPLADSYAWLAWSYDNVALVKVDRGGGTRSTLLACDAITHTCDRMPHRGRVLLPTS